MAFKDYDFELTEIAESDIDITYEYIAETLENPDAPLILLMSWKFRLIKYARDPKRAGLLKMII